MKKIDKIGIGLIALLLSVIVWIVIEEQSKQSKEFNEQAAIQTSTTHNGKQTARVMAHGDLLYHDVVYASVKQSDGTYDFTDQLKYVKPWFDQADLVVGDFEGTIRPDWTLAGYPVFNAPVQVVDALKWAGYDVLDLAHNHILDTGLHGLKSTVEQLEQGGITPIGVYTKQARKDSPIVVKEINGIKIAFLAYTYGFNDLDALLSQEEKDFHLSDLNEEKMRAEIEQSQQIADVTIVMPQMGVEYALQPNEEQKALYHKMIAWGADVVLGNHPHVVQPAETVVHQGDKKLIIYSMGNFLSNQRYETLENYWTERGVLMDVTFEKENGKTIIQTAKAHPTWVSRVPNGKRAPEGYALHQYHVYVLEDLITGGQYREHLDEPTKQRIDKAYDEMNTHVGLDWR